MSNQGNLEIIRVRVAALQIAAALKTTKHTHPQSGQSVEVIRDNSGKFASKQNYVESAINEALTEENLQEIDRSLARGKELRQIGQEMGLPPEQIEAVVKYRENLITMSGHMGEIRSQANDGVAGALTLAGAIKEGGDKYKARLEQIDQVLQEIDTDKEQSLFMQGLQESPSPIQDILREFVDVATVFKEAGNRHKEALDKLRNSESDNMALVNAGKVTAETVDLAIFLAMAIGPVPIVSLLRGKELMQVLTWMVGLKTTRKSATKAIMEFAPEQIEEAKTFLIGVLVAGELNKLGKESSEQLKRVMGQLGVDGMQELVEAAADAVKEIDEKATTEEVAKMLQQKLMNSSDPKVKSLAIALSVGLSG